MTQFDDFKEQEELADGKEEGLRDDLSSDEDGDPNVNDADEAPLSSEPN